MNDYDNSANWHDNFTRQFNDVIADYYDIILFHCAAHFHTDEFRLTSGPSGILLNPSISPDHTNNPTFRQFVIEDGIVTTFNQYYTDLVRANIAAVNFQYSSIFILYRYSFPRSGQQQYRRI